jgi:hypothetical protein
VLVPACAGTPQTFWGVPKVNISIHIGARSARGCVPPRAGPNRRVRLALPQRFLTLPRTPSFLGSEYAVGRTGRDVLLQTLQNKSRTQMHDLSKELFSNEALSSREIEAEFGAVWTRATQFEARVGAAVRTSSFNLEQLLETALQRASPELLDALQAKVGEVQSAL